MSQYMPQMPQQMPMQGYPMQGVPQMPMQQPYPGPDIQGFITQMEQKVEEFKRRYQPPMQQPMMQQPVQQESNQLVMLAVDSMDEAQSYPPDITGKKQWFVCGDEIYSKQFNVKTAGLEFHKYAVNDSEPNETPAQAAEPTPDPQPKQDEINALRAEIAALNNKYKELEGKVNAKPDVVRADERAESATDVAKHDEPPAAAPTAAATTAAEPNGKPDAAGTGDAVQRPKPKPNNRKSDTAKAGSDAESARPDS